MQQAKATDKTDFSEMTASFKIAGDVARNDDVAVKSPFLRLGSAGEQGGKSLEQLQGLTVPVRVTGPFGKEL